jgi:hypothetical protein
VAFSFITLPTSEDTLAYYYSRLLKKVMLEPIPKINLGLIMSLDKLRANGFVRFVVSHFDRLRTSLSNQKALEYPNLGIAPSNSIP